MTATNFALAVKSTLDKAILAVASANGWAFFDMDGAYMDAARMESEAPAIGGGFLHFQPEPKDPLYHLEFEAGPKTSNDLSQYDSLRIVSALQEAFPVGLSLPVMDYSGTSSPTQVLGCIVVTVPSTVPAQFDHTAGFRMMHVQAKVARFA